MKNMQEEIEDARAKVAFYRMRAERPGSRLEDDYALEKARTRLLTLELREAKRGREKSRPGHAGTVRRQGVGGGPANRGMRTNSEQKFSSARERAEEAFAGLRQGHCEPKGAS